MRTQGIAYFLLGVLLLTFVVHGDVVHLTNGRTLEGVVKEETDAGVVLDVGLGSITLKREKILRIEKADTTENMEKAWKDKYFTHKQYVPEGLEDIAAGFNGLVNAREQSRQASKQLENLQKEMVTLQESAHQIEQELLAAVSAWQSVSAKDDPVGYNTIIARHNALRGRHAQTLKTYEQRVKETQEQRKIIHNYLRALDIFSRETSRQARNDATPEQLAFLEKINQRLKGFQQEVHQVHIDSDVNKNGQFYVTARLNDKLDVRMLVDTGASSVSITEKIADILQLEMDSARETKVTLANGEVTEAIPVILDSVQVGDSKVERVPTVVLGKGDYGQDIDGLLGMSFLQEFMIYMDPSDYGLVLQQFDPAR
ncbi:MAG: TIGR02281 family clan AA aspartic protease [Spartobacteria bacterium]|nr:TIGR02281 family clan AA aspartic protease [Spartobacteria bacterium]